MVYLSYIVTLLLDQEPAIFIRNNNKKTSCYLRLAIVTLLFKFLWRQIERKILFICLFVTI